MLLKPTLSSSKMFNFASGDFERMKDDMKLAAAYHPQDFAGKHIQEHLSRALHFRAPRSRTKRLLILW